MLLTYIKARMDYAACKCLFLTPFKGHSPKTPPDIMKVLVQKFLPI